MAAEAARSLDYLDEYFYGSAAPARAPVIRPAAPPDEIPGESERAQPRTGIKTAIAAQSIPFVSPFAVFSTVFVAILMVFVILAQISYNEVANETARLNAQFEDLAIQERKLAILFESVIDMKEVERYAYDVLGMSKPDADQVTILQTMSVDKAEILGSGANDSAMNGLGSFFSSLLGYFKRH